MNRVLTNDSTNTVTKEDPETDSQSASSIEDREARINNRLPENPSPAVQVPPGDNNEDDKPSPLSDSEERSERVE